MYEGPWSPLPYGYFYNAHGERSIPTFGHIPPIHTPAFQDLYTSTEYPNTLSRIDEDWHVVTDATPEELSGGGRFKLLNCYLKSDFTTSVSCDLYAQDELITLASEITTGQWNRNETSIVPVLHGPLRLHYDFTFEYLTDAVKFKLMADF